MTVREIQCKSVLSKTGLPAGRLCDQGYGYRRDQYPQWQRRIAHGVMSEAVRFLVEQGALPRPPDPVPPSFAFIAWKGELRLTSWGVDS